MEIVAAALVYMSVAGSLYVEELAREKYIEHAVECKNNGGEWNANSKTISGLCVYEDDDNDGGDK